MSYNIQLREEELKNKIAKDYFWIYDTTKIIGNIDFCVAMHQSKKELLEQESLLWAEAKKGVSDIYKSFVQLILTIGKARTYEKFLPPTMLGAFDAEKIAFIPYNDIHEIFYLNDFNWNVAPSNHESKEFKIVLAKVKNILDRNTLLYYYEKDDKELKKFIKTNFVVGKFGFTKTRIDKNNFIVIYNKWLQVVKPTIAVNWDIAKKKGVIDGDFYLADLLSNDNITLKDKLFVVLKSTRYELNRHQDEYGAFISSRVEFNDNLKAHHQFWNKYERPPKEEYWDYIVERRDLLVPQDVRERKGSFFTPQIWVELSQKYLTDVLGEDWQDEYYIWDCAAGTGNLLTGLTNKYNVWASTLDKQDVEVMRDRIKNGANLLEDHVFQFDFLNDDFSTLPKPLLNIINDPEERKKLVVYINPPYAEATDGIGKGGGKINVSKETAVYKQYGTLLQKSKNELFAQFLIRIVKEIEGCVLAQFSTLKHLNSPNFSHFRKTFQAKLNKMFIVPANTFDNVSGSFPICFIIWDTKHKEPINLTLSQVFDSKGVFMINKNIFLYDGKKFINDWIKNYKIDDPLLIGYMAYLGNDFQHKNEVRLNSTIPLSHISILSLNRNNIIPTSIYLTVRHCIEATWLNDRDQFLYPNDNWKADKEFQNDCLAFALFHGQNKISSKEGVNHWIPFTEYEVNSREKFASNFMSKFINGKLKLETSTDLYADKTVKTSEKLTFSEESIAVFDAGRALWQYYHSQPKCNVNASLYDIREYFQGRNEKGKMNNKSSDEVYTELIGRLRDKLKLLAQKIEPKVYAYEFLKA
jgi:hypothetical protein